jgi:pyruvate formate lyase activating enzyme
VWKLRSLSIKGLQGTSLIDYPGLVAAVVFTGGCNLRCAYCHNPDLQDGRLPDVPLEQVFMELRYRAGFIDGVVVSGGEPTIHDGLPDFLRRLRELGLKIKLDTNGCRPEVLLRVTAERLADYIAMDYKAPIGCLADAIPGADPDAIAHSAKLLLTGTIPFEFRTTVHPGVLSCEDIITIADEIEGAPAYYLQPYRAPDGSHAGGYDYAFFEEMAVLLRPRFPHFAVRGLHRREPVAAGA